MSDAENSDPKRTIGRPFQPGQSGNPGGRSRVQRDIQAALDELGPQAKDVIADLLKSDDLKVRLGAARDVLDRVLGKAPRTLAIDGAELTSAAQALLALATRKEGDGK